MPRPSQRIDLALLASGRALFPQLGCARLTVRAVAEHAGVNPAMFHYHFDGKDGFLRQLLEHMYEDMFASFSAPLAHSGPPLVLLRAGLGALARFARGHRPLLARVLTEAMAGEPVVVAFLAQNMPRHAGVLLALLARAEREGALRPMPPLQRLVTVMTAVIAPIVFVGSLVEAGALPVLPRAAFEAEVASDAAIDARIDLLLLALAAPEPLPE